MEKYATNVEYGIQRVIETGGDLRHMCVLAHLISDKLELNDHDRKLLIRVAEEIYGVRRSIAITESMELLDI